MAPDLTSSACRKGRRELAAGKYESALATFESVVRARPDCAAARYHLARGNFALGEIGKATRHLRTSLRVRTDTRALRYLATIAPFDPRLDHAAVLKYRRAENDMKKTTKRSPKASPKKAVKNLDVKPAKGGTVCGGFGETKFRP